MPSSLLSSPPRVSVEATAHPLPADQGLDGIIARLDDELGLCLTSGVEEPDKLSRWNLAFASPPIEARSRGNLLEIVAHSPSGVGLLDALSGALLAGDDLASHERSARCLTMTIAPAAQDFPEETRSQQASVLAPLRRLLEALDGDNDPFLGLYGAFGHDLIYQFDPMPLRMPRDPARWDMRLFLPNRLYVADRRRETLERRDYVIAGVAPDAMEDAPRTLPSTAIPATTPHADIPDSDFMPMVQRAQEAMRAGELFSVTLSRRFVAPWNAKPSALYQTMRQVNPSPWEFFLQCGDEQLVGASPEMFVRVEGRHVESAPISGTVRSTDDPMHDADAIRALLNSEKDETELTMCTDVDRNDKARICQPGSVRLTGRRTLIKCAGLYHTVDHVEGSLRPDVSGLDAFLSHMWAATLTGSPKRRAVAFIEEQENKPRGWYGGAVGALLASGDVNSAITIRAASLRDGQAVYQAGATMVLDSLPAEEARETRTKAEAFFRALGAEVAAAPAAQIKAGPGTGRKVLALDYEDSFVHTLADYFRRAGAFVEVRRAPLDDATLARLANNVDMVLHSPGPGRPERFNAAEAVRLLRAMGKPQFGVCLGMQAIAEACGAALRLRDQARHGKRWRITHEGVGLFAGLPSPLVMGAYHSLEVDDANPPEGLEVIARNEEGVIMALRATQGPWLTGIQFHPESVLSLTDNLGERLIANALTDAFAG